MRVPVKTCAMLLPVLRRPWRRRSSQPARAGVGAAAGGVDAAAGGISFGPAREAGEEGLAAGPEPVLAPGIEAHHEVAREAADDVGGFRLVEALLLEAGRVGRRAALVHRRDGQADHRAEDQPARDLVLRDARLPGKAPAADEATIDEDRAGPAELQRLLRRHARGKRVAEGVHAGEEGVTRLRQRLVGLEHHGELRDRRAARPHDRAGARVGGDGAGMREGVIDLAQRHELEAGRQVGESGAGVVAGCWPGAVLLVLLAAAYHRLSGLGHRYPVHWL